MNPQTGKPPVFTWRGVSKITTLFFTSPMKHKPRLSSLKGYGTDGEEALVKALQVSFPNAISLCCFIQNLEEKLKIVIPTVKKEIIKDILGVQEGDVFVSVW